LLKGLGNNPLWCDEALTANVARNIDKAGMLSAWDGTNVLTLRDSMDSDMRITLVPWPQYYVTYASIKLFGASNFSARLPFALFGIGSIFLLYLLTQSLISREGANVAVILLTFSFSFLLYCRNCRYYSLTIFFGLLLFYSFIKLRCGSMKYPILFTISGILLFYSNYVIFFCFYFSMALAYLLVERDWGKLKVLIICSVFIMFLTLPWYLLTERVHLMNLFGANVIKNTIYMIKLNGSGMLYNGHFSLVMLALVIVFFVMRSGRPIWEENKKKIYLLVTLSIFYFVLISFIKSNSEELYRPVVSGLRTLLIILPYIYILFSIGFLAISAYSKWISYIVLTLFICTNVFAWPYYVKRAEKDIGVNSPLAGYIYELFNPKINAIDEVASYLSENAEKGDIIFAEQCWSYQLIWKLGDEYPFCCTIDYDSSSSIGKLKELPEYCYTKFNKPDWIVFSGPSTAYNMRPHMRESLNRIDKRDYELKFKSKHIYYFGRTLLPMYFFRGPIIVSDPLKISVYKRIKD